MDEPAAKSSDKQGIYGYVQPDIKNQFEAYRRGVGLTSDSELLTLLILREIEQKRLSAKAVGLVRQAGNTKISARLDPVRAEQFKAHVQALGRSCSESAAALIERELTERWLVAALRVGKGSE
ncbi:MAG: hypothetical protein B7Z52_03345 [Burkholderiales bacterium 12-64-5]|nr:MAG: hypothetical protein B7Z52_03345 [Burkholderiales bacterium 12-64-5]